MAQRILILGAGATGGYFGGRLVQAAMAGRADAEVTFLVRPARAQAMKAGGLVVKGVLGDFTVPVRTVITGEVESGYDLVLLSCKAYDLDTAMESIAPALGPRTLVLPILNGLAHFDRLDERFGAARILGGCCHLGASLGRDGVIQQITSLQRITFGVRPESAPHAGPELERFHAAFGQTPVDARLSPDIFQDMWEKYVFLTALAALTCLMRAAVGDLMAADEGEAIMLRALTECEAAARQAGHASRPEVFEITRQLLTARGSASTASMLRDLEAGARTEGAHIVADMLQRARAAGSDATILSLAWAHLQAREARIVRER